MKHVNIRILGAVQGVSFRWWVADAASEFHITGFVKNEDNGSISIEAEGEAGQLEKFITHCKKGPPASRISDIQIVEGEIRNYPDFQIVKI